MLHVNLLQQAAYNSLIYLRSLHHKRPENGENESYYIEHASRSEPISGFWSTLVAILNSSRFKLPQKSHSRDSDGFFEVVRG
jgi:hypothetical protein